jgi:beta-amylase
MGPLEIGNVRDPHNPATKGAWEAFEKELGEAKKIGADAVSTDVWWGAVEPKPGEFNWNYYDMLSTKIAAQGLKWVPILSLHQCGGNIGDTSNVPIPMWIWSKIQSSAKSENPDVGKYKSEQGNTSSEYVSAWSTDHALPYYKRVMSEFQNQYAGKAATISEINVSLGPAGELRYPSYNAHDSNSGYPTRGALQSYSDQAKASFKEFALAKYGSEEAVKQSWGEKYGASIEPPKNVDEFYNSGDYKNSQFGKDFFDWYHGSLTSHGTKVVSTALDVFGSEGSAFAGIDIGAKMPGVHWRVGSQNGDQVVLSDRQAELSAGLITTSRNDWHSDADGRGYRPIITMFKDLQNKSRFSRVIPHFTALEMADGHEGPAIQSMPYTLARWVGQEANRQGLVIKGENALAWNLPDPASWQRMASLMKGVNPDGLYDGLTFLRISDVLSNDVARTRFQDIISKIRPAEQAQSLQQAQ